MRILPSLLALAVIPSAAFADPIDDFVGAQMARSHIPGVAVAIVEDGKVASVRSYGTANLEWNAPVDGDTAFQLASATKLFTGVLLMKMAEEGKLSLADPIARFFEGAPESWSKIKVLQLANHTSGLSEDLGKPRPQTIEGLVAASMKAPLAYEPGTEARYGFIDFIVLRAILEK
ncbi:MAG TPA: serine hydrolase domain-containing protein, partial [Allosphingosinicella sp.]